MPSAQARALNGVYRRWFKPRFQRVHSVESLRRLARHLEWLAGRPPRGTRITPVDLGRFTAEWVSPRRSTSSRMLLYLPGGAFVTRTPVLHRALVGRICRAAQAKALLTFYRLAPEHQFPAGLEDCVMAYSHLLAQGANPSNIVIGGDSAGGNLTLATLMALRDRGMPLPAAGFTLSAVTDLRAHLNGTRTTNDALDPMISFAQSDAWNRIYVGDDLERLNDPLVSPVLGSFAGLPPLLMQASLIEVLLDDTRMVAARASHAGVECSLQLFDGLAHVWQMVPSLPESRQALRQIAVFIARHTGTAYEESSPPPQLFL